MKKAARVLLAAAGCIAALSACASEYEYGPPAPYADVAYVGYYDDFYGPFYGGYWGPSGVFYYADREGRHFHRDQGRHFRPGAAAGYHPIQGRAPAPRGHRGGPH